MSRSKARKTRPRKPQAAAKPAEVSIRRLFPVLMTGAFLAGIFLLPYHIAGPGPNNSQSWEFGFNNTAAQALIALMLLALFAWQLFFGRINLAGDLVARTIVEEEGEPVPLRSLLLTMGTLQLLTCALLITWYNLLPMSYYGEFTYFIQRVEAAVLGRVPYVDFAFDYGPALIAMPVGIYRLFHGAVSVEAAYTAALIINFTIGFGFVTYVLTQVNARGRVLILAMLGFEFANLSMGLQYTPLRFTISFASLFGVRHIYRLTADNPARRALLLAMAGFVLPPLVLSVSPEMGLALSISLCVFFLWFLFGPERRLALLAIPVLVGVGATAFLFPQPYFHSMLSFGKGGGNFPIFPTIHILTFLAAAIWIFPRLGLIAIRDKSAAAPFCAALAFLCGLLILPATGRCDSGHVWANSIGLVIIGLSALSWLERKWWYTLWGFYFVLFPLSNEVSFWDHYQQPIHNFIAIRNQLSGIPYDADNYAHLAPGSPLPPIHYSKLLPVNPEVKDMPNVKIGLPLGADESLTRYLVLNRRDIPMYFIPPYNDISDEADLQREYQQLKSMDYIFVPMYFLNYLQPVDAARQLQAQGAADSKWLSGLLLFPVDLPAVHAVFQPDAEIMRRIGAEYGLVKQYRDGVLLKRKD